MKKMKRILALIALPLLLASCNDEKEQGGGDADANKGGGDTYPIDVCVVSGKKLGSMGDPVVYDHEGTTVKFCCDACIPKFKEDPDTYVAKLKK